MDPDPNWTKIQCTGYLDPQHWVEVTPCFISSTNTQDALHISPKQLALNL